MLTSLFSTKKNKESSERGTNIDRYNDMGKFTRRDSERTAPVTAAATEKPNKQEKIRVDDIIKARLNDSADILDISKLELQEIPLLDIRCSSVTTLISCKNPMIKFDGLQQFTSVKVLNLSGCGIENISVIGVLSLVYLQSLDLSRNSITNIPDDITSLYALEVLNLQRNKLEKLPVTMNNLKYLRKLDLSYNKLSSVCDELEGMPRLEEVNFSGNPDLVVQDLGPDILRLFIQRDLFAHKAARRAMLRRAEQVREKVLQQEQRLLLMA